MIKLAFVSGAVVGAVVILIGGAALGIHAQDPDPEQAPSAQEIAHAATVAGVDEIDLAGAVATTGLQPLVYLRAVGEVESAPLLPLPKPPPVVAAASAVAECIIRAESHGNPSAVNPRSGAAGLGQFLPGTWLTTPAGRAGASVFDPVANRQMVNWMLSVGRGREFVTYGGCR